MCQQAAAATTTTTTTGFNFTPRTCDLPVAFSELVPASPLALVRGAKQATANQNEATFSFSLPGPFTGLGCPHIISYLRCFPFGELESAERLWSPPPDPSFSPTMTGRLFEETGMSPQRDMRVPCICIALCVVIRATRDPALARAKYVSHVVHFVLIHTTPIELVRDQLSCCRCCQQIQ